MRIARFAQDDKHPQYAFVQKDAKDNSDYLVVLNGYPFGSAEVEPTGERISVDNSNVRLLAPVIPSKIYGFSGNFCVEKDMASRSGGGRSSDEQSSDGPLGNGRSSNGRSNDKQRSRGAFSHIFLEPSTVIEGNDDPISIPQWAEKVYCGPQIAVIMAAITRNVSPQQALKRILGYMCANDMVAIPRDDHKSHGDDVSAGNACAGGDHADNVPNESNGRNVDTFKNKIRVDIPRFDIRARNFDASTPIGPWIQTDIPDNMTFRVTVNGKERPELLGHIADLKYSIAEQISFISQFSTLLPGDIILTGTPADFNDSAAVLTERDEVVISATEIGDLRNIVI